MTGLGKMKQIWGGTEMAGQSHEVFQTVLEFYSDDKKQIEKAQVVFSAFAKMETWLKEDKHAKVIYNLQGML